MSEARELMRRVVVAGDGQLGVLAAIALKRALPACEVVVIGAPPDPAAMADRLPTALPFTNKLHDRLGIDEERLVREAGASHRLVVRYRGWGGFEQEGTAPYGAATDPRLRTGFARAWGIGPRNESAAPPPGSLAEVLAASGHFAPPTGAPDSALNELDYALRWNVPAYRDLLVGDARRLGVRHTRGAVGGLQVDERARLAALHVEGMGMVEADLFIDCTGPAAALLSQLPGYARDDWSAALPIRALLFDQPREPMLALEDRVTLSPVGWLSELAGRDGRRTVLAMIEGTTREAAYAALPVERAAVVPISPGRASEPWLGNVVAIGDAAAHFEPLGWFNLDLAHRQLALLLELLPGRQVDPRERAEFNRRAALMSDRVRDILGAHYAAPAASHLGRLDRSPELTRMLDQYTRRARLPFAEEAPLLAQEHAALLQALGYRRGEGALSLAADPSESERAAAAFAIEARSALQVTPPYGQWMRDVLQP